MYRICIKGVYLYNKRELTRLIKKPLMKKAFQIYKKGTTDNWITILIPIEAFNLEVLKFKIEKYLALGYEVKLIK